MKIVNVDPRRAVVETEFSDGRKYTYTMVDFTREEHGPVLAAAMAWATLELETCETKLRVWQAQQFIDLRKPQPPLDGKKPKKLSEKDVEAATKTSDGYTRMRADRGRAAACANMLGVMAALVSAGKFTRKDRAHTAAGGRS